MSQSAVQTTKTPRLIKILNLRGRVCQLTVTQILMLHLMTYINRNGSSISHNIFSFLKHI